MPQIVTVPSPDSDETRVTFTSSEVGNGSANDSGTQTNQDGGLAVRVQAEAEDGTLTGPVTRYTDEDIVFITDDENLDGATFDVRDLVSGAQRGNQFASVQLGTQGDDTLTAYDGNAATYINAGQGDDDILGSSEDDFLVGGAGNDRIEGSLGNDGLLGGAGDDTAVLNVSLDGSDTIDLGAGDDRVEISRETAGQVRLTFTSAEVGNANANDSGALANQDGGLAVRIQAEGSDGELEGDISRADDEGITFLADEGVTFDVRDLVSGVQRGNQFVTATLGTAENDEILGTDRADYVNAGQGNDRVFGGAGNDFLVGGAGDDVLEGGTGVDGLLGGAGNDAYSVDDAGDQVFEAVGGGDDIVIARTSYTLAAGQEVETLRFANATQGNLNLTGNEFDNEIRGNNGNNVLEGGAGADVLIGNGGNDVYGVDSAADQVFEAVNGGNDTVIARTSYRLAAGQEIELLRFSNATQGDFNLIGNEFNNEIRGNDGDNLLDGGAGADVLVGNGGDDTYGVDNAGDQVFEAVNGGNDTVIARTSYTLAAGQEIETLRFSNATQGDLNLTGNEFANEIRGNNGNNVLDGGAGADILVGNGGNDTYGVDNAGDQVIEAAGGGNDTVIVRGTSYTLGAGQEIENLRFSNATQGDFDLTGNAFANDIRGNEGDNRLDGGAGADILTSRGGEDTFVFSTALGGGNVDRITDFAEGDTIELSASIFTALSAGELDAGAFKDLGTGASIDADDRILYNSSTGALSYDADGNGAATAVQFATLQNRATLSADDFVVA